MSPRRTPVSGITGRRQGPALRIATIASFVLALVAVVTSGDVSLVAGIAAVGLVTAAPLLRVVWLIVRWVQERDWRFVGIAAGLLSVVALGAVLTIIGVG